MAKKRSKSTKATGRNYAAETVYQSSPKLKRYRAELNRYNRKRGTYGNGDRLDASHRGGRIAGFEPQSRNRARKSK